MLINEGTLREEHVTVVYVGHKYMTLNCANTHLDSKILIGFPVQSVVLMCVCLCALFKEDVYPLLDAYFID